RDVATSEFAPNFFSNRLCFSGLLYSELQVTFPNQSWRIWDQKDKASSLSQLDDTEGKATLAGLILSALERATTFLEERLPEINLDGVVGFQVLEVQLRGAQEVWALDPLLQPLSLRTGQLADKLAPLLHRSITYLNLSDPDYLREFQPSLQPGFWKLPHTWTHTNTSLVYPWPELQDSFSEDSSDACLVLLLGTGNTSSQPCGLSDFCRTLMTKPGCSGYCLSHQLLFFLWARMKGCVQGLFSQSQHYISVFCANMMDLNRNAEAIRYASPIQDLFMENIMFCGIAGFSDFYKLRWLEAILSWQKPQEGCFGVPAAGGEVRPAGPLYQQHVLRRVKRREKQFTDGCSSHSTATAVAALGGFLYLLADQPLVHESVVRPHHHVAP
uniref:Chromosome 16 open reading frame 89 n=1 Tax=Chinchilla lanigera TaxID=34839 RepID=A0A8C2VQS9_CHILA